MPDIYAIIQGGVVVNVILWDASAHPSYQADGLAVKITNVDPRPGIGWKYDSVNDEFINPSENSVE